MFDCILSRWFRRLTLEGKSLENKIDEEGWISDAVDSGTSGILGVDDGKISENKTEDGERQGSFGTWFIQEPDTVTGALSRGSFEAVGRKAFKRGAALDSEVLSVRRN